MTGRPPMFIAANWQYRCSQQRLDAVVLCAIRQDLGPSPEHDPAEFRPIVIVVLDHHRCGGI
jgi:hypothetical protein